MWVLLAACLLALPFLSLPGRFVFDTRDTVWLDPTSYLSRAFVLWRSSPFLGHEQHDGIAIPMGVAIWLLRSVGLSAWAAERVWHGALIFASAATTILLVDQLRGRKTIVAPVAAGLTYSLTPYTFAYGLSFTGVYLPYVFLPLLLLVTLRGIGERGLFWPAMFGLTTLLMGGGNGAPQVYVLLTVALLMAWAVFVERTARLGNAVRFGLWSLLFFAGLNAYWLFLLGSGEVMNALVFSEQPAVINVSSSASESIRGLGFWQYYGGDRFGPWMPAVRPYVTSLPLLVSGYAVPVAALLSAWLVRWRYRLFFLFLAIVSVVVAVGIFPAGSPTPFGRLLTFLYDHVPGAAGLRTTYKVTAQLNLALALLAGIGLEALWVRTRRARRRAEWRLLIAAVATLVIATNAYPLWAGRLYHPARGMQAIPSYWEQALAYLDREGEQGRAYFAPTTSWAMYNWGALKEGVTAADWTLPSVVPIPLPVGERYGSNLLAAVAQPYMDGLPAPGTAALLRRLGARVVVLQNDMDWRRSQTARPAELAVLASDPDLQPLVSFGLPGQNVIDPTTRRDRLTADEQLLPPVSILSVRDPAPVVRTEGPDPVVLSGDGFGLAAAVRNGLVPESSPILYSGLMGPRELQSILDESHPSFIVTDSNRRQVWSFTSPRPPHSYTLPAGQTIEGNATGYLLFDDAANTQSVAVYPGLRSISASGYGSAFGADPERRPANAFDGDPATWWTVAPGRRPAETWIQADFDGPRPLSTIEVRIPAAAFIPELQSGRLRFSDGSSVPVELHRGSNEVSFPQRSTTLVRLQFDQSAGTSSGSGAAVADIVVPGLDPSERIRVPSDLLDTARAIPRGLDRIAAAALTYHFERARTGAVSDADEEVGIARRFEVPAKGGYALSATARLASLVPDDAIDDVLIGPRSVRVTSSGRLLGDPALRGGAAFDGDPLTEWVTSGSAGQWLTIRFPHRTIGAIDVDTGTGPGRARILQVSAAFSDGTVVRGAVDAETGRASLSVPPVDTSAVTIRIDRLLSLGGVSDLPASIREVRIPGVDPVRADPDLPARCVLSREFTVDGTPVSVRPIGSVGDLLSGEQVNVTTCDGSDLALGAGWHDIVARGALQPDTLTLSGRGSAAGATTRPPPPSITVTGRRADGFEVDVEDARNPYYLIIGQNHDPGWHASIDGDDLGSPLVVDGFSTAWRVDRPGSYTIEVRYAPQRVYAFALVLSGVTLVVALSVVLRRFLRRASRRQARRDGAP